ncbi:hypothetical protein ACFS07_33770 [Undibacterium arcticum]
MTINSGRLLGFALALAVVSPAGHAAPQVTPSGDGVPENLLRIELQLDTPLASPLDMHHVVLLDEAGAPIDDAFLDVPLHSRDGMRVSILMHPGRIKTGVGPNIALGMALHSGETVVLAIDDPQFPEPIRKTWVVGPALRQRIDLQRWAIRVPAAASREPLRIDFSRGAGLQCRTDDRGGSIGRTTIGGTGHAGERRNPMALYTFVAVAGRDLRIARPPEPRGPPRQSSLLGVRAAGAEYQVMPGWGGRITFAVP